MNARTSTGMADDKHSVAAVYEDEKVADAYLAKRMQFTWQRLLHRKQVACLNRAIAARRPSSVLELAPGPARLSTEVSGFGRGVMVENSEEMIRIARQRLKQKGLDATWSVIGGSAFELEALLPEQAFDLAYTFRFIRHFREPERAQLYRGIHDRLSNGGVLVFDVVNKKVRDALDARMTETPKGELSVYDATYTPESFRAEIGQYGFDVVGLQPVLVHFGMQSWLSYKGDDVAPAVVDALVRALELIPSGAPLEWVAVCTKA